MKNFIVMFNSALWMLIFGAASLIGLYVFILWALAGFSPYFLQNDECLDFGGGWNYEKNICQYEE